MILRFIAFYRRWISPLLPPRCRFFPSCSAYAAEAIETHGTITGGRLALFRVCRCHPFNPGGYDPVPESVSKVGKSPDSFCHTRAAHPAHPSSDTIES